MEDGDLIITIDMVRERGLCHSGTVMKLARAKMTFAETREFLDQGMSVARFRALNDGHIDYVVDEILKARS